MKVSGIVIRKARKAHRCFWCDELIAKGETYHTWTCFDAGDILVIKVHIECHAAWNTLGRYDRDEVDRGSYNRGCTCENGRCECPPKL